MINGVIFDLDGTIWDSIHFRIDSWKKAFKDYGLDADPEIIQLMIGYPGSMLIKKMKMKDPNIEMLEEKYYNEHLNEVKFFPDVENTFKELRKRDIKIGIVTSSRREMINKINLNVDAIVTMDDIKNGNTIKDFRGY